MRKLSPQEIERIRELRYEDGLSCPAVAREVGRNRKTVGAHAPGRPGKVPNGKLREAFLKSGKSAGDIARRLGWMWYRGDGRVAGDGSRVRRTLGLITDTNGSGVRTRRHWIDAETASLMAEAIGVMPWEVMPDDEEMAA